MNIGEVLKEIRIGKKLTQIQVQKRAKVSQPFLSQLESGSKQPSKKVLKRLCDLYKVPPQIVIWKTITENDITKNKIQAFRLLKPQMDEVIDVFLHL